MSKYVEDFHGNFYKVMDGYYLKISPSKSGIDRRFNNFLIKRIVNEKKVRELVHLQFADTTERWVYQGECFQTKKCLRDYDNFNNLIKNHLQPYYPRNLYFGIPLYLFSYNGKLVYSYISQYFPRCELFTLDGNRAGWTSYKWLKPVYNLSTNKYM